MVIEKLEHLLEVRIIEAFTEHVRLGKRLSFLKVVLAALSIQETLLGRAVAVPSQCQFS